jgi:hypothetical protein
MPYLFNEKERERISSLLSLPNKTIYNSKELRRELANYASLAYGADFPVTCINCIQDAKDQIKLNNKNLMKPIERKSKYILKPGNHYFNELCMHVSNNNLTDELAVKIIEMNAKNAAYFEYAPQVEKKDPSKEIIIIPAQPETKVEYKKVVVPPEITKAEKIAKLRKILDAKKIHYAKNYGIEKLTKLVKDNM